ncbi:uncharacterized protein BJ212DRAFT_1322787 [Suillus subaureus]|uniref:CHAT domain-containing protein n=1 Tax=Suillus subaureus TaxID=48587 RepID=A0A9P7EL45_9AGAM|nr:uncharacterized protein BJ212DRAFT_1322787 [Suillus subaureus]KAG1824850.1 hypothetical protein BJ212DRAFT_1322787 [Suillus subaureus]
MFTLARVSSGVPPLNSLYFLYMQQDPMRRGETACHRFTSPLVPPRWRYSFVQDSALLHIHLLNIFGNELRCVAPELADIAQRLVPIVSSFTSLEESDATVQGDIIRSNWENPEFAFLSACHTTVGDEKSPDESIHLAAAMQFSGFRSVARQVVSAFYDKLVDDSGGLDCTRAAMALHKAVKKLRRNKISLEQQIAFVHIGI